MNAAFRARRARPCAKDLPRPAGDHRAAEPRRADLLRPREEVVRQLHGRPPRRRTPRALVRRAAGDAARPGEREPRALLVPPYVGFRGWIGVRLDRDPDWDEIE